jgi:crotonobetainyl-CoA:carnitine CoA-transferase CaiB-like acyl-CoA transferase
VHLRSSGGLLSVSLPSGEAIAIPGLPLEIDGERTGVRRSIPGVGEHTREILLEAGLDARQIAFLEERGVIAGSLKEKIA